MVSTGACTPLAVLPPLSLTAGIAAGSNHHVSWAAEKAGSGMAISVSGSEGLCRAGQRTGVPLAKSTPQERWIWALGVGLAMGVKVLLAVALRLPLATVSVTV